MSAAGLLCILAGHTYERHGKYLVCIHCGNRVQVAS